MDEALQHPDINAVLVVTSSDTHVDLILRAIKAGKAVMCEKPLAPNLFDAQRCIDVLGARARMSCSHSIGVLIPGTLR